MKTPFPVSPCLLPLSLPHVRRDWPQLRARLFMHLIPAVGISLIFAGIWRNTPSRQ